MAEFGLQNGGVDELARERVGVASAGEDEVEGFRCKRNVEERCAADLTENVESVIKTAVYE